MGVAIEVAGVSKSFGTTRALDDVSLDVGTGSVLALLGPNGAGKTTLVRMLTTLLQPDSGRASIAGSRCRQGCQDDPDDDRAGRSVRHGRRAADRS